MAHPLTDLESRLLERLTRMQSEIDGMGLGGPKPDLMGHFRAIDEMTSALPKGASPDLLHYLHKKSYEKARMCLLGRNSENSRGHCTRD